MSNSDRWSHVCKNGQLTWCKHGHHCGICLKEEDEGLGHHGPKDRDRALKTTADLKPCPFCGGVDIYIEPDERGSGGQWVPPVHVGCSQWTCCGNGRFTDDTVELAVKGWNTRASAPDTAPNQSTQGETTMTHVYEGQPDARQSDKIDEPVSRFRPRYRALTDDEKALHDAIKAKAV